MDYFGWQLEKEDQRQERARRALVAAAPAQPEKKSTIEVKEFEAGSTSIVRQIRGALLERLRKGGGPG